ncbi:Sterol regulatory element-binding ECM22 [Hyphodiscus hymeniophilus]|uniref:Sterol regulatory element-binding ECM22 n=1 Tax=Hyphodiscus hymeniophilus TaxID=353542 RepID=A0A9P6VEU1_9HELO|nr:Sterol regulatory element-binding ECM22 [Hyphodiscus hymeniophilus]
MDITKRDQQDSKDAGTDSTSAAEVGVARIKITDDMFVGWSPPPPNEQPNEKKIKGIPRLSHKKSKTGCQRCRARRVKCDEGKPICGGCSRHNVTCFYDHLAKPEGKHTDESEVSSPSSSRSVPSRISYPDSNTIAPAESKERRLLELRLMHQWTLNTCLTFPLSADPSVRDINTTILPKLSLENEALLYCIFFLSALHLMKTEPANLEARENYLHYYSLTITAHRVDVNALSHSNADVVCLTAALIRLGSFAILQERSIPPYGYEPPRQWMSMNQGTTTIHRETWKWIGNDPNSIAYRSIVQKSPNMTDFAALFAPANREHLLHLLSSPLGIPPEPWTPEIEEAYCQALSFIGAIQLAIDAGIEGSAEILRRCLAFPGHMPKLFFDMVGERRPRALVVLAHYFAYLVRFREIWWIGEVGMREVRAIAGALGPEWVDSMRWPLGEVERVYA